MRLASFVGLALSAVICAGAQGQILLTNFGPLYTQNFNTLISSGTSTTVGITGWHFVESGFAGAGPMAADNGTGTASGVYSYGSTSSTERALGTSRGVSGGTVMFGAQFQNNGAFNMTFLKQFQYDGEQWRRGLNTTPDRLDFQISLDATSLTTGTWTDFNAWDFVSLHNSTGASSSLDGNLAANRTTINGGVTGGATLTLPSPVAPGATFWMRWVDVDNATAVSDAGLAIDNFQVRGIPEPSSVALCGLLVGAFGFGLIRRRRKS